MSERAVPVAHFHVLNTSKKMFQLHLKIISQDPPVFQPAGERVVRLWRHHGVRESSSSGTLSCSEYV